MSIDIFSVAKKFIDIIENRIQNVDNLKGLYKEIDTFDFVKFVRKEGKQLDDDYIRAVLSRGKNEEKFSSK